MESPILHPPKSHHCTFPNVLLPLLTQLQQTVHVQHSFNQNTLICSSAFMGLTALAQHDGANHNPHSCRPIWWCVQAVQSMPLIQLCMHMLLHTLANTPHAYLTSQDAQPPRPRGIHSLYRPSCRRSSHSRHSPGRWRPSAPLAADRLPYLPAGNPGRGRVTCCV